MKQLFSYKGFFAYIAMIFLNAFVDLGHKIVIQNTIFKMYDGRLPAMPGWQSRRRLSQRSPFRFWSSDCCDICSRSLPPPL